MSATAKPDQPVTQPFLCTGREAQVRISMSGARGTKVVGTQPAQRRSGLACGVSRLSTVSCQLLAAHGDRSQPFNFQTFKPSNASFPHWGFIPIRIKVYYGLHPWLMRF